jgi:hypothetical protein
MSERWKIDFLYGMPVSFQFLDCQVRKSIDFSIDPLAEALADNTHAELLRLFIKLLYGYSGGVTLIHAFYDIQHEPRILYGRRYWADDIGATSHGNDTITAH